MKKQKLGFIKVIEKGSTKVFPVYKTDFKQPISKGIKHLLSKELIDEKTAKDILNRENLRKQDDEYYLYLSGLMAGEKQVKFVDVNKEGLESINNQILTYWSSDSKEEVEQIVTDHIEKSNWLEQLWKWFISKVDKRQFVIFNRETLDFLPDNIAEKISKVVSHHKKYKVLRKIVVDKSGRDISHIKDISKVEYDVYYVVKDDYRKRSVIPASCFWNA